MEKEKKKNRYNRLYKQIKDQIENSEDLVANMATITAILHHKMDYFFWTGFYRLIDDELIVGPYQGPVACILLKKNSGVCWAGINREQTIVVKDVHQFPGHIACDARSNSEIVVPVRNKQGVITGVLDVDSKELNSFDEEDANGLEKIINLLTKH